MIIQLITIISILISRREISIARCAFRSRARPVDSNRAVGKKKEKIMKREKERTCVYVKERERDREKEREGKNGRKRGNDDLPRSK